MQWRLTWNLRPSPADVDGVTWQDYEVDLESNVADLHDRVFYDPLAGRFFSPSWVSAAHYPSQSG
jgi:hypothetical protein